jgi:tRNA(His) 5'-end guanylyltransferase
MRREGFAEHLEHFEVLADRELMAGFPAVARLQVRALDSILTDAKCGFAQPYDVRFGKMMVKTASHLLEGTGSRFAFAETDEISTLLASEHGDDGRQKAGEGAEARELLVRMAAQASAKLSLLLGAMATFDARLYQFPNPQLALEYFRWRQEQARLRALDRYCGYALPQGATAETADTRKVLEGMAEDEKVEILRNSAIDFEGLPKWQRLGAGLYMSEPETIAPPPAESRPNGSDHRLFIDADLPSGEAYTDYLRRFFARG